MMVDPELSAMVLGAGRGTRLGPTSLVVPKILVEVGGAPLLARQIDYLAGEGVSRVVVNAHHLAEQVSAFAATYAGEPELVVVEEERLLGTAGGVRNALEHLGTRPFLILYGDVMVDESLGGLLRAHRVGGAGITISVYESDEIEGKGTVQLDPDDRVTAFVEKGGGEGPGLINAGIYVVDPVVVAGFPVGVALDFGHDVFPTALAHGTLIQGFRLERPVIDVGTPAGLDRARELVATRP